MIGTFLGEVSPAYAGCYRVNGALVSRRSEQGNEKKKKNLGHLNSPNVILDSGTFLTAGVSKAVRRIF